MRVGPVRCWYLLSGGSALGDTLVWTLAPVYFVRTVGMSPLQLVLVGTFMELTIFACEIPTGIVADVVSRRLSVVIGYLVMGGAIVFSGLVAEPAAVMAAWSVWGLGYTFGSGATDAWLADEIGVENVRPVYLRSAQLGRAVALAAIGGSVALGLVSLQLPIVVGGAVIAAVGLVLAFAMPEQGFRPAPRGEAEHVLRAFVATGRSGCSSRSPHSGEPGARPTIDSAMRTSCATSACRRSPDCRSSSGSASSPLRRSSSRCSSHAPRTGGSSVPADKP